MKKRSEGYSGIESNILLSDSIASKRNDLNDFTPIIDPIFQMTQMNLPKVTKFLSYENYAPGQMFYPNNPGDSELHRISPLLSKSIPPNQNPKQCWLSLFR